MLRHKEWKFTCRPKQNITNIEAVKYYSQFADVMVTARELGNKTGKGQLQQLLLMKIFAVHRVILYKSKFLPMELFAWLFRENVTSALDNLNSSANRGACLQQCRRKYTVTDKETGQQLDIDNEYIMSPKDLNTVALLDHLLDAGVRVLKLEGRGRSPEYVKTIASVYREAG